MSSPEHDGVIEEWMASFQQLPKDRQKDLKHWFATQKIIMDSAGLTEVEWFGYVEWAMNHPFDYSFIHNFPEVPETEEAQDSTERNDATRGARQFVGGQIKTQAPTAESKTMSDKINSKHTLERELFARFMNSRRT